MFLQLFSKKVCFCCILGCFAEKELPQMSQIFTEPLAENILPQMSQIFTDAANLRMGAHPNICEFRGFCGKYTHPNNLCRSVTSVGEYHSRMFCEFCEICGRISQQEGSVSSVKSVGEYRSKKAAWVWQGCHTLLKLVLFDEHGGVGGDALHTTGEAELLCSCCLD